MRLEVGILLLLWGILLLLWGMLLLLVGAGLHQGQKMHPQGFGPHPELQHLPLQGNVILLGLQLPQFVVPLNRLGMTNAILRWTSETRICVRVKSLAIIVTQCLRLIDQAHNIECYHRNAVNPCLPDVDACLHLIIWKGVARRVATD